MTAYAELSDLYNYGAPQKAFGQLTDGQKEAALEAASRTVDTYYRARFQLPLSSWDKQTTKVTAQIATYDLLSIRGYNPASGSDVNIKDRYDAAITWLEKVAKQQAHPEVTAAQIDVPAVTQPMVISSSVVNLSSGSTGRNRGW